MGWDIAIAGVRTIRMLVPSVTEFLQLDPEAQLSLLFANRFVQTTDAFNLISSLVLHYADLPEEVVCALLELIGDFGMYAHVDFARHLTNSNSASIRCFACDALSFIGNEDDIHRLTKLTMDAGHDSILNRRVCERASNALEMMQVRLKIDE